MSDQHGQESMAANIDGIDQPYDNKRDTTTDVTSATNDDSGNMTTLSAKHGEAKIASHDNGEAAVQDLGIVSQEKNEKSDPTAIKPWVESVKGDASSYILDNGGIY